MENPDLLYQLALLKVPGVGNYMARQLVGYFGSARAVFEKTKGKLQRVPGIGPKTAAAIHTFPPADEGEKEIAACQKAGIAILTHQDKRFPSRLKHAADGPFLLYAKGDTDFNAHKVVAVVGTRKATQYGIRNTEKLVEGLASLEGVLVVSGLAYGIDVAAHKACLTHQLPTVGVMAHGLNMVYPDVHANVAQQMTEAGGALVSEYPIGTLPDAPRFPERNRIVAGMSDAVVVVEAARKGGALITAQIANSYDREVFSFPGDVGRTHSAGCHQLIKMHQAHLISDVNDLIELMNWDILKPARKKRKSPLPHGLNKQEKVVCTALLTDTPHIDILAMQTGLSLGELANLLLSLELRGVVKALPGKKYRLT